MSFYSKKFQILVKVFGTAFKACLSNRQRLQKEQGKAPLDVDMVDEGEGVFKKQGTFRYFFLCDEYIVIIRKFKMMC